MFTPDTCPYELDSIAASLAACGMEHLQADMVTGQASRPPIFEVGTHSGLDAIGTQDAEIYTKYTRCTLV